MNEDSKDTGILGLDINEAINDQLGYRQDNFKEPQEEFGIKMDEESNKDADAAFRVIKIIMLNYCRKFL